MLTRDNLMAAFAGESQANRKYLAFAKKADSEGFKQVAKLFRAAAEAETVHAHAHLRVLGGIKGTVENLEEAITGEGHEFKEMYPGFIRDAIAEGNKAAEISFKNANVVEEIHYGLYGKAVQAVRAGKDLDAKPIWVCAVCGNTVEGSCPDKCSVCNATRERFSEIK